MSIAVLVSRLADRGVRLHLDGGELRFRAPAGALTDEEWCAPDFVFVEIGSVLWKKVRRGQVTAEQAGLALTESTKAGSRSRTRYEL